MYRAAVLTCYHGDGSGFPQLLRFARGPDAELRRNALAQSGGSHDSDRAAEVVPVLLAEVEKPLSDEHLEAAIHSLAGYPGEKTEAVLTAHLNHRCEAIHGRVESELGRLRRVREKKCGRCPVRQGFRQSPPPLATFGRPVGAATTARVPPQRGDRW